MSEPGENPYAAPATPVAPEREAAVVGAEDLKDPRTLGWIAIGFLWLYAVCRFSVLLLGAAEEGITDLLPEPSGPIALGVPVMFVATAVALLLWTYRCAANARRLERNRMNTSPAMAVISYFIPIYNLFGPCMALKEVIRITYRHTDRRSVEPLVFHWWLGWVAFLISSRVTEDSAFWWFPLLCMGISAVFLTLIIVNLSATQAEVRVPVWASEDGHSRLRHSPLPAVEAGLPKGPIPRHPPVSVPKPTAAPPPSPKPSANTPRPRQPGLSEENPAS